MNCTLSSNTTNLDKDYVYTFHFSNNSLEKVEFTTTTRGDPSLDEKALNDLYATCKQLSQDTESIVGLTVKCRYTEGKLVEEQRYDLQTVDLSEVRSSFAESGGNMSEYPYGQDMDVIERGMNASGFQCKREY